MEYRENPMFGRQVFFLNPPLSVENTVLPYLKDLDYEVYVIRKYSTAKPVLRMHENAICFIFVDDELSMDAWFNFIKSFETDPSLKSVFLGILSIKAKPKEQERFMMNLKLPGGFVMMEKNMEVTAENLEGILKINGAKGVRKCIRLELNDNTDVNGYFTNGSMLYSFRLVDISALGFAAVVPVSMANVFQKGRVIPNVSITMKRYSFVCSVVIFNCNISKNSCMVVMLLSPDTSVSVKRKIHDFIYETLELRHRIVLENIALDLTDYNIRVKVEGETEDSEDVEDAEDVEEIVNEENSENTKEKSTDAEQEQQNKNAEEKSSIESNETSNQ